MHSLYEPIDEALDQLANAVEQATNDTRSLLEASGWNFPAADRFDFAYMVRKAQRLLRERAPEESSDALDEDGVAVLVSRINAIRAQTLPYLFNGNGAQAAPAFSVSMHALEALIEESWPLRLQVDPNSLPSKLARHSRTAKARLDEATANLDDVQGRLALIAEAHQAAESLPTDLEELRQARATLTSINGQSATDAAAIKEIRQEVTKLLDAVEQAQADADSLVKNCEDAYQITTTKGLAGAFDQRAENLANTMWVWVAGLVISLLAVALIGHNRIGALTLVLAGDPKWGTVTLNFLLSAISVGAPLWFAWVATKQIGQRFRLAEDYAFKASVAKAYEGYRKQAVQIDPKFESQLFGIALSRLEEAPLRMVEAESHGSPWHEIVARRGKTEDRPPQTSGPKVEKGEEALLSPKSETETDHA